ncbi:hypothetical protein GCM10010191_19830 [Actinomadura vinacea]|uniref:Uncharacterized protein n=1 Tax=Actinomadura vinacea TaxID=115336 RepID=A0ABP5VV48_9ACTN
MGKLRVQPALAEDFAAPCSTPPPPSPTHGTDRPGGAGLTLDRGCTWKVDGPDRQHARRQELTTESALLSSARTSGCAAAPSSTSRPTKARQCRR